MRERQGFGSFVFRTSDVGARRPTNDKAAKRRPVIDPANCHKRKIWSGRRGSNPRPRPWQGRALPLSYTRIRDGGERSPSTADLCQMRTANATVRVRSGATPDNPISLTNGSESVRNNAETGFVGPVRPSREPRVRRRRDAGRFEPFSTEPPTSRVNSPARRNRNRRSLGLPRRGIDVPAVPLAGRPPAD